MSRGGAVWQLVGLITRRSGVQVPPPQPCGSIAQLARAFGSYPECHRFESYLSHHKKRSRKATVFLISPVSPIRLFPFSSPVSSQVRGFCFLNKNCHLTTLSEYDILFSVAEGIGEWCNGNTWVSKTFVEGSNPSSPASVESRERSVSGVSFIPCKTKGGVVDDEKGGYFHHASLAFCVFRLL